MTALHNRQKLHEAMASLGASRAELARLLDTPHTTLDQWLDGTQRTPGIAIVAADGIVRERARETKGEKIVRLAQSGTSVSEIKAATNAAARTIERALRRARAAGHLPPIITLAARVRPFADGAHTPWEIADVVGLSVRQVYGAVSRLRLGGEIAALSAINTPRTRIPREQIVAMLTAGYNSAEIGHAAGATRERVRQIARSEGLHLPHSRVRAAERRASTEAKKAAKRAEKDARIDAAITAVSGGASMRHAAQEYHVPINALHRAAAARGVKSIYDSRWRGRRLVDRMASK